MKTSPFWRLYIILFLLNILSAFIAYSVAPDYIVTKSLRHGVTTTPKIVMVLLPLLFLIAAAGVVHLLSKRQLPYLLTFPFPRTTHSTFSIVIIKILRPVIKFLLGDSYDASVDAFEYHKIVAKTVLLGMCFYGVILSPFIPFFIDKSQPSLLVAIFILVTMVPVLRYFRKRIR